MRGRATNLHIVPAPCDLGTTVCQLSQATERILHKRPKKYQKICLALNVTVLVEKQRQHEDDSIEITLLTIYDKGEISSVTDKYIKWLVSLING